MTLSTDEFQKIKDELSKNFSFAKYRQIWDKYNLDFNESQIVEITNIQMQQAKKHSTSFCTNDSS